MSEEIWKPVPGHPMFEVSNLGRARNVDRAVTFSVDGKERTWRGKGRILRPWVARNGYLHVSHKSGGLRRKYLLHRLVGMAFVDGFDPGLSINHKNGIKTDNRPENLEWITLSQNTAHQWQVGLVNLRGERHPLAKLSDKQADEIRTSPEGATALASKYGVSSALIYKIRKGQKRKAEALPN